MTFYNLIFRVQRKKFFNIISVKQKCSLKSPTNIHLFKVNNGNTRKRCETYSKLTIKTPGRRQWLRSGVFFFNFEHISHLFLVFFVDFEQVNSSYVSWGDMIPHLPWWFHTFPDLPKIPNYGKEWKISRSIKALKSKVYVTTFIFPKASP